MLGFTLPMLFLLGAEGVLGAMLLGPPAIARPAAALAKATYSRQGATVTYTIAAMLGVLLLNPLYDGYRLHTATADDEKASHELAQQELATLLSAVLLLTGLGGLFFVRKLGVVVGECERKEVSERALLKQAQFSGVAQGARGAGAAPAPAGAPAAREREGAEREAAALRRQLEAAAERAAAAEKAQRGAETNLSAFKTQYQGLANEYDRLLSEKDELQRRLQRAGLAAPGGGADKKGD
eukprot:scaffold1.g5733.t1